MSQTKRGNRPITLQERSEIMVRAERKENDTQIADAMNLSIAVVRKWRRRTRDHGRDGLIASMGRPRSGPLGHFSEELRDAVKEMRDSHPGWGAGTLRVELTRDLRFANLPIPSEPRIAAYLKSKNMTRPYERHSALTHPAPQKVSECHEEWEMDAQGVCKVAGVGLVNLINIVDPFSRVRTSWACLNRRKAARPDYQLALRRAFFCFGKPLVISLDHDSAFFDNTTPSPFPSPLHLWLIAMGVEVRFLEHRPPREHAFIERSHQIIHRQAVQGQAATPASLQPYLDQRLEFLNRHYPSRSLNRQAPLIAYPQASHSGREYRPEWEEDTLDIQKVYAYLSRQEWFRQSSDKGQLLLGSQRYGVGKDWSKQTIHITFDSSTQEYICGRAGSDNQQTERLLANGLTKTDLMGELNMTAFANHQYAFPWDIFAIRKNQIADLIGTTL
jgi:transposase